MKPIHFLPPVLTLALAVGCTAHQSRKDDPPPSKVAVNVNFAYKIEGDASLVSQVFSLSGVTYIQPARPDLPMAVFDAQGVVQARPMFPYLVVNGIPESVTVVSRERQAQIRRLTGKPDELANTREYGAAGIHTVTAPPAAPKSDATPVETQAVTAPVAFRAVKGRFTVGRMPSPPAVPAAEPAPAFVLYEPRPLPEPEQDRHEPSPEGVPSVCLETFWSACGAVETRPVPARAKNSI